MRKMIPAFICSIFILWCGIALYRQQNTPKFWFGSSIIQRDPSGRFVVSDVVVTRNICDSELPDRILTRYLKTNGIPSTLELLIYDENSYYKNGVPYKILEYDFRR